MRPASRLRAYSSAVEHLPYKEVVGGSIPSAPTTSRRTPQLDTEVDRAVAPVGTDTRRGALGDRHFEPDAWGVADPGAVEAAALHLPHPGQPAGPGLAVGVALCDDHAAEGVLPAQPLLHRRQSGLLDHPATVVGVAVVATDRVPGVEPPHAGDGDLEVGHARVVADDVHEPRAGVRNGKPSSSPLRWNGV